MQNKFEQLIEFIINDEEDKAKDLFHEVVVEKSREIYENLMQEDETVDEAVEEVAEETVEESTEEETVEESFEDDTTEIGGDAADDLIGEIEADEEGIALEDEEAEEELEDRVVDLEDKLDELMAEFEGLMADEEAPEAEEGDMEMEPEAEEEAESEEEAEEEVEMPFEAKEEATEEAIEEAVSLTAVKADTADHSDTTAKSPTPANGGAKEKLADAHPAKVEQEKGATTPKSQDMGATTKPDLKKV